MIPSDEEIVELIGHIEILCVLGVDVREQVQPVTDCIWSHPDLDVDIFRVLADTRGVVWSMEWNGEICRAFLYGWLWHRRRKFEVMRHELVTGTSMVSKIAQKTMGAHDPGRHLPDLFDHISELLLSRVGDADRCMQIDSHFDQTAAHAIGALSHHDTRPEQRPELLSMWSEIADFYESIVVYNRPQYLMRQALIELARMNLWGSAAALTELRLVYGADAGNFCEEMGEFHGLPYAPGPGDKI